MSIMKDKISTPLEKDRLIRSIAKGAGITMIGMFASRFLGYGIRMITARSLTTEGYGQISIVQSLITIIAIIALFGIPKALTRQIAFYRSKNRKTEVYQSINSGIWISMPLIILSFILIWVFKASISQYIFHDPALIPILSVFAFLLPLQAAEQLFGAILLGFKKIKIHTIIRNVIRFGLTLLTLAIIFYLFSPTPVNTAWAYTAAYIITIIFYIFSCKKFFKGTLLFPDLKNKPTKRLISFSWPLILSSIFWILLPKTDILMLGYFKTSHTVGIYNAAVPLGEILMLFSRAFIPLFIPIFTELISQHKNQDISDLYRLIIRWTATATIPVFLALIITPKHMLYLFFGSKYIEAAVPLQILAAGYLIPIILGPNTSLLIVMGKTKTVMLNNTFLFLINICLNILLIPPFGLIGAALATASSFILHRLLTLYEIIKETQYHPFDNKLIKTLSAGAASSLIYIFIINNFSIIYNRIIPFLIAIIAATLIYGLILILLKTLTKDDIMILQSIKTVLLNKKIK